MANHWYETQPYGLGTNHNTISNNFFMVSGSERPDETLDGK